MQMLFSDETFFFSCELSRAVIDEVTYIYIYIYHTPVVSTVEDTTDCVLSKSNASIVESFWSICPMEVSGSRSVTSVRRKNVEILFLLYLRYRLCNPRRHEAFTLWTFLRYFVVLSSWTTESLRTGLLGWNDRFCRSSIDLLGNIPSALGDLK